MNWCPKWMRRLTVHDFVQQQRNMTLAGIAECELEDLKILSAKEDNDARRAKLQARLERLNAQVDTLPNLTIS